MEETKLLLHTVLPIFVYENFNCLDTKWDDDDIRKLSNKKCQHSSETKLPLLYTIIIVILLL